MERIIKESLIYRIFVFLSQWIKKLFCESFIIGVFTKESSREKKENETVFIKVFQKVIDLFRHIAFKLKLDKVFDNSIFAKPMIWLTLLVFFTPFIPTMLALALLGIVLISLLLKIIITKDFNLRYSRTNLWVVILMGIIIISGFASVSLLESRKIALLLFAFSISYFSVINSVETRKDFKFLMYVFIIAGTITAIYGIYQYMFGDVFSAAWVDEESFENIKMRAYSTFENPNVYGEYLILVLPCIMALLWTEKGLLKKLVLLGMLGITLLAALLTFSRGCWLGIILEFAILLLIIDKRFIILGLFGLLLLPFVLPQTIIDRFISIGNMGDTSTSYRVYIWLGTIAMLKDYWFSGVGLGASSFNSVYPIYSYHTVTTPHSHNLFLQLMAEYGIIGLLVFILVMYNFFKETIISNIKNKNILLTAFISGMSGFLLESLFDYTWYNYRVVLIFWIYIALGLSIARLNDVGKEAKKYD